MFERVVVYLLNKYLGKYVQDLDVEKINLGILNGEVELLDLQLKHDALYELDCPIEVKKGCIGRVLIKIPWRNLNVQPVIINIEDVLLLATPIKDNYDPDHEKKLLRAIKNKKLKDVETSEYFKIDEGNAEFNEGFWEKILPTVINNIQLYISSVHICYEDVTTNKDSPFSCGVILHNLTAETTNNKWKSAHIDANVTSVFKLIKLESFSVYWNSVSNSKNLIRNYLHSSNWKTVMKKGLETFSINGEDYDFILKPVSAKVKVIMNKSNEAKVPKLLLDFVLQDVAAQISRQQYLSILALRESFQRMVVNRRFLKFHPGVPASGNVKKWWIYAYNSVLEELVRCYSWSRIQKHRETYKKCRELYRQRLHKPLDAELRVDLIKLEDMLDLTSIVLAREEARIQFSKEEPQRATRMKVHRPWWKFWPLTIESEQDEWHIATEKNNSFLTKLSSEEKQQLLDAIGHNVDQQTTDKPKQYTEHKLNFTFANCTLSLLNYSQEVLVLTLTQFLTSIDTRPTAEAFRISARVESFLVEGAAIEHDLVPIISADNISGGTTAPYVFALDFEKNPLHVNADFGILLQTEPIEIVYQEHAFSEITAFFHYPHWKDKDIRDLAKKKCQRFVKCGKNIIKNILLTHKKCHISMDVKSPYIIIPEHGTIQKGGNVLVLDLGRLQVKSDLQQNNDLLEESTRTELEERLYDRFYINFSDIQILFADSGDEWRAGRMVPESEAHLVPKLRMQLIMANSVKPDYRQLPRQKVNASLPCIKVNLSDRRLRQLFEFMQNLPYPTTRRIYAQSSNSSNRLGEMNKMDMSEVIWEPSILQLKSAHQRVFNVMAREADSKKDSENGTYISPTGLLIHQPSEIHSSHDDHSDEELEQWARTVDLPGFDDNVSPSNAITVLLRFIIGEVVIQLARSSDHVDKPYLMLRAEKLCSDVALMEYGPALQASLGGIQLVDKLHMGSTGEYLELITSVPGASDTVAILYRKVRSDCPDFRSHFHNVEQSFVVTLSTVRATFHRGAFMTLHKFLQYVMERLSIKAFRSKSRISLNVTPTQFLPMNMGDPPVPPGATKCSISARIDEIKIRCCDSDMDLTDIKIAGLETDFVLKANEKMVMHMYLSYLSVDDLSDMTLYTKILSIEDDKVFDFKYVQHSRRASKQELIADDAEEVKCDASVRLKIGRVQFCLLYKFLSDLKRFLDPFHHPEFVNIAIKTGEKVIFEQIQSFRNRGTTVSLSVDIHAPIILIPQKSDSPNLLLLRLGDLSLENFFKEVKIMNGNSTGHLVDNLLIRLNFIQMNRAIITLDGSMEEMGTILEPLRVRLDIKRAVPPFHRDLLVYDIRGNMDTIKINIGQRDLGLLMGIFTENTIEGQLSERSPGTRMSYSPMDTPSPISCTEDAVGKKLQAFFNTSLDVYKEANCNFTLEGAQLIFYYDSDEVLSTASRNESHGLSKLEMDEASLSLEIFSDRSLEMKCALQALSLEDIRQESSLAVTKIFQSYSGDNKLDMGMISVSMPPMIDVSYKQSQTGDIAVDILMEKTRLNVSVPYVLALIKFLYEAWPTEQPAEGGIINPGFMGEMASQSKVFVDSSAGKHQRHASSSDSTSGYHSSASTLPDEIPSWTITAKLKKPEVVLFADPMDKNSHVLVLKADVFFDYNHMVSQKSLSASVAGLQLLSCVYGKRRQTAYLVMQPCDIEVSKSTTTADETTTVRTCMSQVDLRLSTSTVHTLRDVIDEFASSLKCSAETLLPSTDPEQRELQDLWATKKIQPQKWTERTDDESEPCNRALYPTSKSKENFVLNIPSIQVICELEEKKCHIPLVLLRMGLEADAHDWCKQLYMKGELRLELSYYNEKLSTWEPIIEPVMQAENSYRPWELLVKVFRQSSRPIVCNVQDDVLLSTDTLCGPYSALRSQTISESSSSGDDTESDQDMTIIRKPSMPRLKKIHAQKSYESGSLIGYEMDSDSENEEGILDKLATAFGHMFTSSSLCSDSSEAEESESEKENQTITKSEDDGEDVETESGVDDEDETDPSVVSPGCDKPIFLTKQGESMDSGVDDGTSMMATYVIVDSRDKLDITLSPVSMNVILEVINAFTSKSLTHQTKNHWTSTNSLEIYNKIGPLSKVMVTEKSDSGLDDEDLVLAMSSYDDVELPSSPASTSILVDISPTESEGDVEGDEVDRFSISSALTHAVNTSVNDTALVYEEADVSTIYEEVVKERIAIQIDGFDKLQCYMPRRAGIHVFALHPQKNDTRYHVVVNVDLHHGCKAVTVSSPLQIRNCLAQPINLYYKKKILESLGVPPPSHPKNPFEEKLWLATLQPDDVYHVPLFVAYHCHLFVKPSYQDYLVSESGIWWQELSSGQNQSRLIMCSPKNKQENEGYSIKVVCTEGIKLKTLVTSGRLIPNYNLSLYPPLCICNFLPYPIEISAETFHFELKLEPGEQAAMNNFDLSNVQKLQIEISNYLGVPWSGKTDIYENMEEHRTITMTGEFNPCDTKNKQLTLSLKVERTTSLKVCIYSPYWIINKTGLPLQLRGSGSGAVYETSLNDEPLLFRFKRHRRKKAKMRIYNSRWSSALSMDNVGSDGVVICKDKERGKKHQFLLKIRLSQVKLTKLVLIMPYFLVTNNTKRHLRFMEQNEKADFWVDINPGESIPFWPDTDTMQMHVKLRDSNIVSQPFFIHKTHDTVLRMDQGSALCVHVHGGTESPMTITFYPYIPGNAPVRVENWCEDLFLKIHQKSMGQVALLSPYQSVLYTWDDPTKERTLMWNIYNRNKPGFPAFIGKDGHGQEKVSFHTLRPTSNSTKHCAHSSNQSSTDDDSDLTDDVDLKMSKKTRRDKVVVYWVSYLDGHERVLMFTQDERIAKQARKKIDGSKSTLECCISLGSIGLSLINAAYKEVTFLSLSNAPAIWEVEINNKWKMLPLELSAWLEDKWKTDQIKAEMKDYVQVDFTKMQMTKPFFGRLFRKYFPAVWCQYRGSQYLSYFHLKIHRLQIDNQLPDAVFPSVLYPSPLPPFVVRKTGLQPFFELLLVQRKNRKKSIHVIKYFKILVQEFNIRIDKGFLMAIFDLLSSLPKSQNETKTLTKDLEIIHSPLIPTTDSLVPIPHHYMFEYVHLSPLKINFSFSPRGISSKNATYTNGYQDILELLSSTIGATLSEVKDVHLKLPYFQCKGIVAPLSRLLRDVQCHYRSQIVQQFFVYVLGLDVLGNPYAAIQDFTQGLGDYFYEPFMGIIKTPEDYADSIALQMQALLGHVVGDATRSSALVTGPLSQALPMLSFDEDYRRKRRQRIQPNPNFPEALVAASRTFAMGVTLSLSGLHIKPVVGIHQEGIEGFFKGIGKGLMGLLTKPAGGIVDTVSMAYDGVRRAAEMGEDVVIRTRLIRYLNPQQGVRPFSSYQAAGYRLLLHLSKGHYAESDVYWAHATLKKEDHVSVVLVTDRHVFELVRSRLWSEWDVLWKVNLDDIMAVPTVNRNKMVLKVRQDDSFDLFPGEECLITCDDSTVLQWIQRKIEKVLITHLEDRPCPNCG